MVLKLRQGHGGAVDVGRTVVTCAVTRTAGPPGLIPLMFEGGGEQPPRDKSDDIRTRHQRVCGVLSRLPAHEPALTAFVYDQGRTHDAHLTGVVEPTPAPVDGGSEIALQSVFCP